MPHQPDDDGYEPPLKVLRKRLDGVYREDHGFSGPTRRYILMVVILVALASVPTLAVITAGTSEMAGESRNGAMDVPFLPPPVTGPVRPSPPPSGNHSRYDRPAGPPSDSGTTPKAPPGVSPPGRASDGLPAVPGLPPVPEDPPASSPRRSDVEDRPEPVDAGVVRPKGIAVFPTVPGLPTVPDDDWGVPLARRAPADDEPDGAGGSSSDKPDSSDTADSSDGDRDGAGSDGTDSDGDGTDRDDAGGGAGSEGTATRTDGDGDGDDRDADMDTAGQDPDDDAGHDDSGHPDQDDSPHHECEAAYRSTVSDRPRRRSQTSRRSAVTERPHNVNAARILDHHHPGERNIRRSQAQPRSEEGRTTNGPYRGHHRAEHTLHDEHTPARQRSSRVGRHHAEHATDDHYLNRR